jgi:hypothetical protein
MFTQDLARMIVENVAHQLVTGVPPGSPVDVLRQALFRQLQQTPTGQHLLTNLLSQPADPREHQYTADYVAERIDADPQVRAELEHAARQAGMYISGSPVNVIGNRNITVGPGATLDRSKRFHIGSLQFGFGGLASGIAVLVLLLGGGTAAAVGLQKDPLDGYRKEVLAACDQSRGITTANHNEVFRISVDINQASTNPTDLVRINKAALIQVLTSNLAQVQVVFGDLDKKAVPAELQTRKHQVDIAFKEWVAGIQKGISQVKAHVTDGESLTKFMSDGITADGSAPATGSVHLNSAMTNLAGTTCIAVGNSVTTTPTN